ncbi:EGF domain-specific O-linked N-acetylglucosamine transferase-like [Prunus avium]|uniref:EGF domain-specific O-linked N-acetylglucosamine transferase-like n=1 Tax=Prunus avium TaxID=42229 RepID=A0A6P5RY79_PRUAV|nr:EGF domain-specific O-linked N-acetylglucosamine transferase-like [Prunus avium]
MIGRDPNYSRPLQSTPSTRITCTRSHKYYDFCFINGSTVLDPTTSTFFMADPTGPPLMEKIKPYPRKLETSTMSGIKELILTSGPRAPKCQIQHNAPALVFSAGGYTGNVFHDFNDGFNPIFIIVNSILHDQEPVLVMSKARDWWVSRYGDLLRTFTKHPIINLDNDTANHCFTSASVGLTSHGLVTINPKLLHTPKTLVHFHGILDKAFGRNHHHPRPSGSRLRLVLISRTGGVGREMLNQNEVKQAAEKVGFEVVVFVPSSTTAMHVAYNLLSKSHAMVGVHGAAMTHLLFMRPGSVFMQIVPLGTHWLANVCYESPARAMGLQYIDYRINVEESSLVDKYGKDDIVVKDPVSKMGSNWSMEVMKIYLKEQNVKLDLDRFNWLLKAAYDKAKKFMDKEG